MEIREITDQSTWENFFLDVRDKTFLQSWDWGEFERGMGNAIWRFGLFRKDELVSIAFVTKITARRGTFLLVRHGPVMKRSIQSSSLKFQILAMLVETLKRVGKEERASFLRVAPLWERTKENSEIFREIGFREAPMHANAYEATLKLDLTLPEEKLLENMRKTTRYLIRQTLRNPHIKIVKSNSVKDVGIFDTLSREVARRQRFNPFSFRFIKHEFETFSKDGRALLLFGEYKGEIAAGALVIFWSGIGFYHQAASRPEFAKFSLPYRIQWEAIKEAKQRGCTLYDFWGYVDPQKYPKHPWAGPSLFKLGFGGTPFQYIKTQDYPLSIRYWATAVFEQFRKISRHL